MLVVEMIRAKGGPQARSVSVARALIGEVYTVGHAEESVAAIAARVEVTVADLLLGIPGGAGHADVDSREATETPPEWLDKAVPSPEPRVGCQE